MYDGPTEVDRGRYQNVIAQWQRESMNSQCCILQPLIAELAFGLIRDDCANAAIILKQLV